MYRLYSIAFRNGLALTIARRLPNNECLKSTMGRQSLRHDNCAIKNSFETKSSVLC